MKIWHTLRRDAERFGDPYLHAQARPPWWFTVLRLMLFNVTIPAFFLRSIWGMGSFSASSSYGYVSPLVYATAFLMSYLLRVQARANVRG